jgi:hypothetical protein
MIYVAHRVNTINELKKIPEIYGVEVDLRDCGNEIVLQHNPFIGGELFEDYLRNYRHRLLILNIKSERIEFRVLKLLKRYGVRDYFFLDSSFPMIFQLFKHGEYNTAVRLSEFESIDTVMRVQGLVKWVWVDCFTKFVLRGKEYEAMKRARFSMCLVSPELQGRHDDIVEHCSELDNQRIIPDAVCTKLANISLWSEHMIRFS